MGWTSYQIYQSPKKECDDLFTSSLHDRDRNVVGQCRPLHSVLRGNIYYASVEYTYTDGRQREVVGVVCRIQYCPKAHHDNFAYKDMDETMEPFYYDCPKVILEDLTPTTNEYALRWRKKCRENIEKKEKLNKVKIGEYIMYINDFNLTSANKGDIIYVQKYGKYNKFSHNGYQMPVKFIPNVFTVISEEEYEKRMFKQAFAHAMKEVL